MRATFLLLLIACAGSGAGGTGGGAGGSAGGSAGAGGSGGSAGGGTANTVSGPLGFTPNLQRADNMGLFIWKVGNPLANACDDATGSVPLTGVAFDFSDLGSVGTYVVLPNGFSNDGGRSALMTMFRWGPDGGFPADGGLSVLSSGTITLTQVGSQFVGSFSVTLHEFFTGADAGELAGPFSAPFCP